jgi:hypothetical protein
MLKVSRNLKRRTLRRGTSLMEVVVGLTLATMLLVPTISLMNASHRVWRQFESGHGAVAVRQAAIQEVQLRLDRATRLLNTSNNQVRFVSKTGENQRIYQNGNRILWQHGSASDLLAEGVGALRFRQIATGSTPDQGQLLEVRLQNSNGSNVADTTSTALFWVRPNS